MTREWLLLVLVVVLLAASAFFVAAEFSLIAARRTVIEPMAVSSARARATLKAMENVSRMMACAQLGITLCGVLLGALGEPAVAALLEPVFHALGVPEAWLHPVSLVIALLLVVSAHVALGEMVPKNIAIAGPEQTALVLAPPLMAIATAIGPIIRALNHFANAVVRLTGREPKDEVASVLHPRRGRRSGRRVAARGSAGRRGTPADHLGAGLRHHRGRLGDGARRRGGVGDAGRDPGRDRTDLRPDRASPGSRSSSRTAGSPVTCTSATSSTSRRSSGTSRSRRRRSGRCRPSCPETDLRTALDRMRRIGAHLAEVADAGCRRTGQTVGSVAGSRDRTGAGQGDIAEVTRARWPRRRSTALRPVPAARGVVMLEDVIEALIGEIRDATRRSPDRASRLNGVPTGPDR